MHGLIAVCTGLLLALGIQDARDADYPTFDPQPIHAPNGLASMCLNGKDWRLKLVEQGHRCGQTDPKWALAYMIKHKGNGWMSCTVPGSVQSALLENGWIKGPQGAVPRPDYFGVNSLHLTTATVRESWFKKTFRVPADWRGKRIRLWFGAVDYQATFYLNGHRLGSHEGHFEPVVFEVSNILRYGSNENLLTVQIAPFPGNRALCVRSQILKNLQSDCTPAACPLGVSDDVFLLVSDTVCIDDLCIRTELSDEYSTAAIIFQASLDSDRDLDVEAVYEIRPLQGSRETVVSRRALKIAKGASQFDHSVKLKNPQLWWPNGAGDQNLYEARLMVQTKDGRPLAIHSEIFGIRELKMAYNEGAEKSRFPWTFVVNGQKIFCKGANWAPADYLYRTDAAMYERLLRHAQNANFNMLRWWGGGVPEREAFYNLCDRYGIMLYHDFFLANGDHFGHRYLELMKPQARALIRRLRNHPSIVLWSGGNEMGELPATKLLAEIVAKEDPTRPYRPCSPTDGEHHGPYLYDPETHYSQCDKNLWPHFAQFRSEFGSACAANADTLRKSIPAGELKDLPAGDSSGVSLMLHNSHVWMDDAMTRKLFGAIEDLDCYCQASQLVRADGLRYAIEAFRRQQFRTSGTLYWQYNETWPNAAGNATVDWFARPRITHDYVRSAYEPVHACLKYNRITWKSGQPFRGEVWVVNDRFDDLPDAEIEWSIYDADGLRVAGSQKRAVIAGNRSTKVDDVSWHVSKNYDSFFVVYCTVTEGESCRILSQNHYIHSAHCSSEHPLSVLLNAAETTLNVEMDEQQDAAGTRITVRNVGARNALVCGIELPVPLHAIVLTTDNNFCLPPGGERTVLIQAYDPTDRTWQPDFVNLSVKAWNSADSKLQVNHRKSMKRGGNQAATLPVKGIRVRNFTKMD